MSRRGHAILEFPAPALTVLEIVGYLDGGMGDRILAVLDEAVVPLEHLDIFCDWSAMTGYASEARSKFTQWMFRHRAKVSSHLLVTSKLVAMGVSVANLTLGGILIAYTDRAAFTAVLHAKSSAG
jgi:hypothetical protein